MLNTIICIYSVNIYNVNIYIYIYINANLLLLFGFGLVVSKIHGKTQFASSCELCFPKQVYSLGSVLSKIHRKTQFATGCELFFQLKCRFGACLLISELEIMGKDNSQLVANWFFSN